MRSLSRGLPERDPGDGIEGRADIVAPGQPGADGRLSDPPLNRPPQTTRIDESMRWNQSEQ